MHTKEKVLIHKGIDMVKRGMHEKALEYYDRALEINPNSSDAWNNKGVALYRLNRIDEALQCYHRALEIDPDNLDAMRNIAFVHRARGEFEKAMELYETVMERGGDAYDLEAKATILVALGRFQEAIECIGRAYEMTPDPRFEVEMAAIIGKIQAMEDLARESSGTEQSGG
ncbi:tetratricopeptide repeat protein [Methanothrix sp.]|uniref:tetratricopeptide repeat protein n=1 Tax=Methanothrix sp. TaxID=90426 RepID=UPI002CC90BA6|nr:tetratricopeptide repeat protein [Methanothrix sp.]HOK58859.1 tetratricopeptide repeat protein [Methanothrix sp.]HOL44031.1 tetratricopeptide repeat protein [Methanothrix sp.]HPO89123.1 tetratricopeptide repeat protein [Methanothrix sp.]